MEENLHGHVTFLHRSLPNAIVDDRDDLLLVDSGLPTDTFNKICRARLAAPEVDYRIAEAIEYFRETNRPYSWWVGPRCRPFDLESRLEAAGLRATESEVGMVVALRDLTIRDEVAQSIDVRRVMSRERLEDFILVLDACGAPSDPHVGEFLRSARSTLLQIDCPMRLFVGYIEDLPVATSELFVGGGVAGVHMVATDPQFRRRGFGWTLTSAALEEGRRLGLETATLQASPAGESVYRSLGFRAVCRFSEYQ